MHFLQTLIQKTTDTFERDAQAWGLRLRTALVVAAIPLLIMLVMVAIVPVADLFVWITAENSLMEWLQFLLVLASSFILARLSLQLFQSHQAKLGILCLMVALGTFFVAGEEIAWGQHIFGWSTPEALEAVNVQQETTLHNIASAHPVFVYAAMFAGLYGTIVPFLGSLARKRRLPFLLRSLLIPPICLVPAFFMPFGYRFSRLVLGVDTFFPHLIFPITKFSEVSELCLYFGLTVFSWLNLRQLQTTTPSSIGQFASE